MSEPWSPEQVVSVNSAAMLIETQFPELKPVHVEVLGEGFDNTVFLINHKYVFRFPRRGAAASLITIENRLLPVLAPLMNIPVPNPEFQGIPGDAYPWPFEGYKALEGKNPTKLTNDKRIKSVERLAHFLKQLHSFPVKEARSLEVPYDLMDRVNILKRKPLLESNVEKAKKLGIITQEDVEQIEDILTMFNEPYKTGPINLVHGDLHFRNLLVGDNGGVSAVIDWGDTHIGHPAIDLSVVYGYIPPEGRVRFFELYGDVPDDFKDIARFKAIYTATLLLLYAKGRNDREFIEDSYDSLQLALSR